MKAFQFSIRCVSNRSSLVIRALTNPVNELDLPNPARKNFRGGLRGQNGSPRNFSSRRERLLNAKKMYSEWRAVLFAGKAPRRGLAAVASR